MPIFTQGPRLRRDRYIEEFPAPLGQVLGAAAEEAWVFNPTNAIGRQIDLSEAKRSEELDGRPNPVMTLDEQKARITEAGVPLTPEEGLRSQALDLLIERKRAEVHRQSVLSRGGSDLGTQAAKLGVSLVTSMLDPVNVAVSFVPVVGPARYAAMLEKAGSAMARAGVRLRVGALEGAVGAALIEPVVYGVAQAEQADYGLADSLLNISVGSLLGGGLHTVGGAFADRFLRGERPSAREFREAPPVGEVAKRVSDMPRKTRAAVLDSAVAQSMAGRYVDVERLMDVHDAVVLARRSPEDIRAQAAKDLAPVLRKEMAPELESKLTRGEVKQLSADKADIEFKLGKLDEGFKARAKAEQQVKQGRRKTTRKEAESRARKAIEAERKGLQERLDSVNARLKANEPAMKAEADLSRLEQGFVPTRFEERVKAEMDRIRRLDLGGFPSAKSRLSSSVEQALTAGQEAVSPERVRVADFDAAEAHQARLAEAPAADDVEAAKADLGEQMAMLKEEADALGLDPSREMAPFDERISDAETYRKALRAFALCQVRR